MGKTIQTAYGAVDAKALSRMQNHFDTRRLFDAIDAIDRIRYRICAADGLRQDLLDLHGMAHEVINEDYGSSSSRKEPIWELAEMLSGEVLEFSDDLRSVFDMLEELEKFCRRKAMRMATTKRLKTTKITNIIRSVSRQLSV